MIAMKRSNSVIDFLSITFRARNGNIRDHRGYGVVLSSGSRVREQIADHPERSNVCELHVEIWREEVLL